MRIHALETGHVSVKENQAVGKGPGRLRVASTLLGRKWRRRLPILAWLIEHPEGLIVVDTGETARASEAGYFPRWHPYYGLAVRMDVAPGEEIGPRIAALGFDPLDVKTVVLTHMHTDHAGGLAHFPSSEILASTRELAGFEGRFAKLDGYLPHRAPEWFDPKPLELADGPLHGFTASQTITSAGDVSVVETTGHTPGHVSVIVTEDDGTQIFLAGDTSYTEATMRSQQVDGVSPKAAAARDTLKRIAAFCEAERVVYLPTHDPESVSRLEQRTPVGATTSLAAT